MSEFITISGESAGEIEEKKSRFIAALVPCTSEDEAVTFIESVRKKNRDGVLFRPCKIMDYAFFLNSLILLTANF